MKLKSECCPPGETVVSIPHDEDVANKRLARFAKALGHPARVAIVRLLMRRETCICGEIVEELPLAQSTVSQHLKQLKKAGLVRGEIDGPRVCYCVDEGAIELLKLLVSELI